MIYILHGDDTLASYSRVGAITSQFEAFNKVKLDENNSFEEFNLILNSQDLLETNKLFILENFITKRKIDLKNLKKIKTSKPIIFWEKTKISAAKFTHLGVNVEEFKLPAKIFYFLDSITPSNKMTLVNLKKLSGNEETKIVWQLSMRFYLIIAAKLKVSRSTAEKLFSRPIADWQWAKISTQAEKFSPQTLKALLSGVLKIDYLIKTGKTDLPIKSLISILFIKYL